MRFLLSTLTVVISVLVTPLALLMVPSISFRIYLHYLPMEFDHPHLQDSMRSLSDMSAVVPCLLPPFSAFTFMCPIANPEPDDTSRPSLHLLLLRRQVLFKKVVHYAPTSHTITSLLQLGSAAANASIVLDDLDQEEADAGAVIGDRRALVEVAQTSANVARALYRVLVQVELGLCR